MAPRENIVVLGGAGMLGRSLVRRLHERRVNHKRITRQDLDLAALETIDRSLHAMAPSAVINASGFTDVNGAEQPERRDEAFLVNRDAPRQMARACRKMGVPLIHVSTDYVFDGRIRRPYLEDDPASPLQVYGRSKLEGEKAVREEYPEALIARTSTLFGRGEREHPHYVDAILKQARLENILEVVELPISSPTYAADLAETLLELLELEASGIVHVVNSGHGSRLELAAATLEEAGLAKQVRLCVRAETGGGPQRPAYSVLDTSRLQSLTGRLPRSWRQALKAYLRECHS